MPKQLIVSQQAENDIRQAMRNVVEYTTHIESGIKLSREIHEKFDLIAMLPKCGKRRDNGTHETFARSYRIVYEETDDSVIILAVIHARRLYPQT